MLLNAFIIYKTKQKKQKTTKINQSLKGGKTNAGLYVVLLNLTLQQMKVGQVEGFKGLENASNVLDLSDINTSDLKPDT